MRPEAIHHQLTAIPARMNLARFDREFAQTNRLRTTGTDHILAAAQASAVAIVVAQSFGGWSYARQGGPVKTEDDPVDPDPPAEFRNTLNAIRHLETKVVGAGAVRGTVLRYGFFYGPRTSLALDGSNVADLRARRFPIVGRGAGIWSFIHIRDAAAAAVAAMESGRTGLYNIADDDPATVSEWLPYLARCVGARAPLRVPASLARLLIGKHAVVLMNELRGLSNRKAKLELGWEPAFVSWRTGFKEGLR
jgi:2-alkyl-3-oxoalkanoate reductase